MIFKRDECKRSSRRSLVNNRFTNCFREPPFSKGSHMLGLFSYAFFFLTKLIKKNELQFDTKHIRNDSLKLAILEVRENPTTVVHTNKMERSRIKIRERFSSLWNILSFSTMKWKPLYSLCKFTESLLINFVSSVSFFRPFRPDTRCFNICEKRRRLKRHAERGSADARRLQLDHLPMPTN